MKTIQLFMATLLCLFTLQFAQASSSFDPGNPSCHCCTKCSDDKCKEMCSTLDKNRADQSKATENADLAKQCEEHCKQSADCQKKMKKKGKSCCAAH